MLTYLDYNATAPLDDAVREAMLEVLGPPGNPSSVHGPGQKARLLVSEAREKVAEAVGAEPEQIIFTSCGTEANAIALRGGGTVIAVSAIEHPAVLDNAPENAVRVGVDGDGVIDLAALETVLAENKTANPVVAIMLANNETGVIQPVAEAVQLAARYNAVVHCDAVQGLGKLAIDFAALGVNSMALSAHKIGGPTGIGALVVRDKITPLMGGGGQERNLRPGTENLAGIVGFGVAATRADAQAFTRHCGALQQELESRIMATANDAVIFGRNASRLANTSAIAMPGRAGETQIMALDLDGIAVSAGAACSSGKVGASHVLAAMGAGAHAAETIRVSTGMATTRDDITRLADAWQVLYKQSNA